MNDILSIFDHIMYKLGFAKTIKHVAVDTIPPRHDNKIYWNVVTLIWNSILISVWRVKAIILFSFFNFCPGWDVGPRKTEKADAVINHSQYNSTAFRTLLHADIKWIVPIREPVSWIKSAINYFKYVSKENVSDLYLSLYFAFSKTLCQFFAISETLWPACWSWV